MAKVGRPAGKRNSTDRRLTEKPFADMVRVVMAEEDEVRKKRKLRVIADRLYESAADGESWAIEQIANRLDGKPAQESTVTIDNKRDAFDWSREELERRLAESLAAHDDAGNAAADGCRRASDPVH